MLKIILPFDTKTLFVTFALLLCIESFASHECYGKISIGSQSISNEINGNKTDVKNNDSRFGVRGNSLLLDNSNLRLVYQA